jgi:branched-chain amino acid transport system permease protein
MFVVAWLIERLVLRHLVNQEGATLLMATLGIAYVLEGVGSSLFGSEHLQDRRRHAQGSGDDLFEGTFEGGLLINKEDFIAA